jgi:peptidyl-prolyl cis-trans isomerase C
VSRRSAWRPYLRFACVGALLFTLDLASPPRAAPPPPAATLDDDALLVQEALARGFHRSDDVVRRRLAQNLRFVRPDDARDEDALVRDAIALGMHQSDLVVRRRLAQKMRLLLAEPAYAQEPSDAELSSYLARHPERFTEPARVSVSQLYFRDLARARAALPQLAATDRAPAALGDPLPLPRELPSHSAAELAARLGPAFAEAVMARPEGRWFGPVPSSYGQHLVRIRSRQPARLSELGTVRSELREALLAERAEAAVRAGIAALRAR